jgi:hypothetical protein
MSDGARVDCHVMFGYVVVFVCWSWLPELVELLLGGMALEPVESHVHYLEPLGDDIIGLNAQKLR